MPTITVPIYGALGPTYANKRTSMWYEISDSQGNVLVAKTQVGVTERNDYGGNPCGVYRAFIHADLDWDYPLIIEWTMAGADGQGVLAVDTSGWEFALVRNKGATLDLDQLLVDTKEETVGGALAGIWAISWGRLYKNLVNKTLNLFGPGNTSSTPTGVFQLDDVTNPTERLPL